MNLSKITRVEYIDEQGRQLVRYLKENEKLTYQVQDEGRTLKIFQEEYGTCGTIGTHD